jgi:hypothetical protein
MASSFWPSRSSAKRVVAKGAVSDEASWYGEDRPECGGVGTNEEAESSPRAARETRCLWKWYFVYGYELMEEHTFGS